jgi:transcriptional antiterminator RfaH
MSDFQLETAWYCVRSHPKHEQIAARHLQLIPEIELFSPLLRIKKITQRGPCWFVESLFPCYLFARFNLKASLLRIRHTPGVQDIVKFGDSYPLIPSELVRNLQSEFSEAITVLDQTIRTGDAVKVTQGAFKGLDAEVIQYLPARQRVKILLHFLGQLSAVEIPESHIVKQADHPLAA